MSATAVAFLQYINITMTKLGDYQKLLANINNKVKSVNEDSSSLRKLVKFGIYFILKVFIILGLTFILIIVSIVMLSLLSMIVKYLRRLAKLNHSFS